MNRAVLILGGGGFLGKALSRELLRMGGWQVSSGDVASGHESGVSAVHADILDRDELVRVCKPFDVVVNCTGQVTQPISRCLLLNTVGISNIACACSMANSRLIHISTVSVYGSADRVDEATDLNTETPYAASKAGAELILGSSLQAHSLTIVRISNLYGPGQTKGLLAYLQRSFRSDLSLSFDNTGDLTRYYLHVEDGAAAIAGLAGKGISGTFNLVGPERFSIREVVSLIESKTGIRFQVSYRDAAPRENIDTISADKLRRVLDIACTRTISEFVDEFFLRTASAGR